MSVKLNYADLAPEKKRNISRRPVARALDEALVAFPNKTNRKRVGRGHSAGQGKTCGRGHKGQKSRSGYSYRKGFEGGQTPLYRRLPKRGFRNIFARSTQIINIRSIQAKGIEGELSPERMQSLGLIKSASLAIKVLGAMQDEGSVFPTKITADAFSKSVLDSAEKLNTVYELRKKAVKKQQVKQS